MNIPDSAISDICIKLREVLHILESYSDSEQKEEPEFEIESSSSQVSYGLRYLLSKLTSCNKNLPSDTLHTEKSDK